MCLTKELIKTEANDILLKQTPFPEEMKDLVSPVQTEEVKETGYKKQRERDTAGDIQGWLQSLRNMFDHIKKLLPDFQAVHSENVSEPRYHLFYVMHFPHLLSHFSQANRISFFLTREPDSLAEERLTRRPTN